MKYFFIIALLVVGAQSRARYPSDFSAYERMRAGLREDTPGTAPTPSPLCPNPGYIFPDPTDCDSFFVCDTYQQVVHYTCPFGEKFNPATNKCDEPANVVCYTPPSTVHTTASPAGTDVTTETEPPPSETFTTATHPPPTTTHPPPPTTQPPPTATTPFVPECRKAGEVIPDKTNCSIYYVCDAGLDFVTMVCPGGLYWNADGKYCDYPANVYCPATDTTTAAPTTIKTTTTAAPTTTTEEPTTTTEEPTTTTEEPTTTTEEPTTTTEEPTTTTEEPTTTTEEPTTTTEEPTTTTEEPTTTTEEPTTTTEEPTTTTEEPTTTTEEPTTTTEEPTTTTTEEPTTTTTEEPTTTTTEEPTTTTTEEPTTTSTKPPPPTTTPKPAKPPAECKFPSEVIPNPISCTSYYICNELNETERHSCDSDLYYDPAVGNCNFPERVPCTGLGNRPLPYPTALPDSQWLPDPRNCDFPGERLYSLVDCNEYWKCNQNLEKEHFTCPPDLFYKKLSGNCDIATEVNCATE